MRKTTLKSKFRLLVVEDEIFNRDLAKILLEKSGHTVFPAAHGVEALEILSRTDVDAVLMDDHMPVMDGTTTAAVIRNCEKGIIPDDHPHKPLLERLSQKIKGSHIPIFALTAHTLDLDRERYINAGMDDYFIKPFEPKEVATRLARMKAALR